MEDGEPLATDFRSLIQARAGSLAPFAVIGTAVQVSGLLDHQLANQALYAASTVLMVFSAVPVLLEGTWAWKLRLCAPLGYTLSLAMLMLSQKLGGTGLTMAFLTPVIATAIYGSTLDSALTVPAVVIAVFAVSLGRDAGLGATVRVVLLSAAMATMVSVIVHSLRARLNDAHIELMKQARTDPLTGLVNRRGLAEGVAQRRARRCFSMVVIDIDGLKKLNDAHGHDAGDLLLQRVGESCLKVLRQGDIFARFGGDEFAVFIADASEDEGKRAAARLKEAISAVEVAGMAASASVGVAFGSPAADYEYVLRLADAAMYQQKHDARRGELGLGPMEPANRDEPVRLYEQPVAQR